MTIELRKLGSTNSIQTDVPAQGAQKSSFLNDHKNVVVTALVCAILISIAVVLGTQLTELQTIIAPTSLNGWQIMATGMGTIGLFTLVGMFLKNRHDKALLPKRMAAVQEGTDKLNEMMKQSGVKATHREEESRQEAERLRRLKPPSRSVMEEVTDSEDAFDKRIAEANARLNAAKKQS